MELKDWVHDFSQMTVHIKMREGKKLVWKDEMWENMQLVIQRMRERSGHGGDGYLYGISIKFLMSTVIFLTILII